MKHCYSIVVVAEEISKTSALLGKLQLNLAEFLLCLLEVDFNSLCHFQ